MTRLVKEDVAAAALGCSVYKLQKDRRTGNSIPYVKIGRSVRYDIEVIEEHIRQHTFTSTSQYGGKTQ